MGSLTVTPWMLGYRSQYTKPSVSAILEITSLIAADHGHNRNPLDVTDGVDRRGSGKGRLRPSMMGNPCDREIALAYEGYPQEPSKVEWMLKAEMGSWLHYQWQAELMTGYVLNGEEVKPLLVTPEVKVRWSDGLIVGSADGLLSDGSLLELKTVGTKMYATGMFREPPVVEWEAPKWEHLVQVNAYMYGLGVGEASVVYIDRDTNDFTEFRCLIDSDIVTWIIDRSEKLQGPMSPVLDACAAIMNGAKVPWNEGKKVYEFCKYKQTCARLMTEGIS